MITSTDRQIKATDVKPGMRYRAFGPGAMIRKIDSVEHVCNCQTYGRGAMRLASNGEVLHRLVVVFKSSVDHESSADWNLTSILSHDSSVIVTDDEF